MSCFTRAINLDHINSLAIKVKELVFARGRDQTGSGRRVGGGERTGGQGHRERKEPPRRGGRDRARARARPGRAAPPWEARPGALRGHLWCEGRSHPKLFPPFPQDFQLQGQTRDFGGDRWSLHDPGAWPSSQQHPRSEEGEPRLPLNTGNCRPRGVAASTRAALHSTCTFLLPSPPTHTLTFAKSHFSNLTSDPQFYLLKHS